jgi:hypothetical protein
MMLGRHCSPPENLIAAALAFLFAAGRMTTHTVLEVGDAFLAVLASNLRLIVLVTAVASVLREDVGMTHLAAAGALAMV